MSEPKGTVAPESDPGLCPDNDPEIAELLEFEPVERRFKREDGWSPALQREFIAELAKSGSPGKACDALGKRRSGIDKLYKVAGAESFRAAWHRAVEIAEERAAARIKAEHAALAGQKPPFLDHRRKASIETAQPEAPNWSDDDKWSFIQAIGGRFLAKVEQERQARLEGSIVAADFYLRQITYLEVLFDLGATEIGWDAQQALRELRRGGHPPLSIVTTPFATMLDETRRKYWESQGDPPRPIHPPAGDVVEQNDGPWGTREHGFSIAAEKTSYGALTTPADGYTPERWAKMTMIEQRIARDVEWERAAAEQVRWEAKARQDYDERRASDASA